MSVRRWLVPLLCCTSLVGVLPRFGNAQQTSPSVLNLATDIVRLSEERRGICTLLVGEAGLSDGALVGELAVTLGADDGFFTHVWSSDEDLASTVRRAAVESGLHGQTVVVETGPSDALPYAENTVDVLVAQLPTSELSVEEILRVLRPEGKALFYSETAVSEVPAWLSDQQVELRPVGDRVWVKVTKPRPQGEGQWSHIEHGPDNNPVADDVLVKAPYMTKWLAKPYYIAMPAITGAANGRMFLATGHIAHHKREEPWLNTLLARNGYNGTELWRRQLPDGYLVHRSAFVALGDSLYMIDTDGSGCVELDAKTGEEQRRIDVLFRRGFWKWMAIQDGVLLAMLGPKQDPPETTLIRSDRAHWSWGELSKGYYPDRIPWGFGNRLVAFDLESGDVLWEHRAESIIDSRGLAIGGGRVFVYSPDADISSRDLKTGQPLWVNADEGVRELIEQAGRGLASTPGFRTMNFCLYTPEILVYQGQTRQNVVALATDTGELKWHRQKTTNNPNPLVINEELIVGIGERGESLVIDKQSGETLRALGFAKRSCARLTGTSDSLFCRGMPEGLTRFDLNKKAVFFNGAVRPSCNDGVIAANGLLYMGPWACDCNLTLMGRVAMSSAGDFDFHRGLERPSDTGNPADIDVTTFAVDEKDWSTYRGDVRRGGSTSVNVPTVVMKLWTYTPAEALNVTAPTAAGNRVFLAAEDGSVRAINAATGNESWRVETAGPVLLPPTLADDRAYVGSGDGYVYCFEAASGKLLWRFRAAPIERRIPVYGKLASTWPVHSGVLVNDGVAYAAAGIIDYDGTYVYALDAKTGKMIWLNDETGHLDPELRKGVSAQGGLALAGGRLWMPGGNVVSPAVFDLQTGDYLGDKPGTGAPRTNRGEEIGVFGDEHLVLGGRLRFSATKNVVNPGYFGIHRLAEGGIADGQQLQRGKIPPVWDDRFLVLLSGEQGRPVWYNASEVEAALSAGSIATAVRRGQLQPHAMAQQFGNSQAVAVALTANAVVAVTSKSVPGTRWPLWDINAYDVQTGALIWKQALPDAAMPGGLSVDRAGRVLVVLEDGRLICFGGTEQFERQISQLVNSARANPDLRGEVVDRLKQSLQDATVYAIQERLSNAMAELGFDVGAAAAANGSVSQWYLLGPVPWKDEEFPADKRWIGEPQVDLTQPVTVQGDRLMWKPYRSLDEHGKLDLAAIYGRFPDVAVYAYAEVDLPESKPLTLGLGSNDGFVCWFNGQEVDRHEQGRGYTIDGSKIPVQGRAGKNQILVKVLQLGNKWALGVRLRDQERPVQFSQPTNFKSN